MRAAVVAVDGGEHNAIVRVEGGRLFDLAGLFVATRMPVAGPFAAQLGCVLETHPMGSFYQTDPVTKETTTPGVFACGDAAVPMGALPFAVLGLVVACRGRSVPLVPAGVVATLIYDLG